MNEPGSLLVLKDSLQRAVDGSSGARGARDGVGGASAEPRGGCVPPVDGGQATGVPSLQQQLAQEGMGEFGELGPGHRRFKSISACRDGEGLGMGGGGGGTSIYVVYGGLRWVKLPGTRAEMRGRPHRCVEGAGAI